MFGRIHLWERLAWLAVTVCLLLATLVTSGVSRSRVDRAERKQQAAMAEAGQLRMELQQARAGGPAKEPAAPASATLEPTLFQRDAEKVPAALRERLIADLQKHNELIPHRGVLGGTMGFYDPQGIRVLGPRWVLADFEDGHIDGRALLVYRIGRDGRIDWRLVDSYLNE